MKLHPSLAADALASSPNRASERPQSVLYVLPKADFFTRGRRGRVTHALGVASGLSQNRVRVVMVSGPGLEDYREELGPDVSIVQVPPCRGRFADWRWTRELMRVLKEVVSKDNDLGYGIVRYAMSNGFMLSSLPRQHPTLHWCFEVNSLLFHQESRLPRFLRRMSLHLEKQLLLRMDSTYVVSANLKRDLGRAGSKGQERVLVIPNAAPDNLVELVQNRSMESRAATGPIKFAYLGVYQVYYELDFVVETFCKLRARYPQIEFHLFGDGPQAKAIERRAGQELGVFSHGRYDLRELISQRLFGSNWVLILPYKDVPIARAGSPTKLFEYMALGLPIIASRVGQLEEVLGEANCGFLYQPGDERSLTDCMQKLMNDPDGRRQMGRRAQEELLHRHTWRERMQLLHSGMKEICEKRLRTTG